MTEESEEEKAVTGEGSQGVADMGANAFSRAVHVNTRRGKGTGTKRIIAEVTAVLDDAQVQIMLQMWLYYCVILNQVNPLFFYVG